MLSTIALQKEVLWRMPVLQFEHMPGLLEGWRPAVVLKTGMENLETVQVPSDCCAALPGLSGCKKSNQPDSADVIRQA